MEDFWTDCGRKATYFIRSKLGGKGNAYNEMRSRLGKKKEHSAMTGNGFTIKGEEKTQTAMIQVAGVEHHKEGEKKKKRENTDP